MRTKALLGLAVLAAGALSTMAQTSVYSLNVVGYYTVTVPAGKYGLIANQMVMSSYSVTNVLSVPNNTVLYKWAGVGYAINTFSDGLWDDDSMTLGPGEATFIKNPSTTAPLTLTFVGEVNQNTNTKAIPQGYSMVSLFTPQAGNMATDFGYTPPATGATQVYQWAGLGYGISTYTAADGWDPAEPALKVGEGFFIKAPAAHTWTRSFKVQ